MINIQATFLFFVDNSMMKILMKLEYLNIAKYLYFSYFAVVKSILFDGTRKFSPLSIRIIIYSTRCNFLNIYIHLKESNLYYEPIHTVLYRLTVH